MNLKPLTKVTGIFERTIYLFAWFALILLMFMWLSISYDVIVRYFFNRSLVWVIEFAEYTLLYMGFLGAAWVLKREGHVKMDMVLNRLNPRNQALLNIITSLLAAVTCLIIVWYGARITWFEFVMGRYRDTPLELPTFHMFIVITVGSFLLFIQFLRRAYGYLGSWRASPGKEQAS